MEIGMNFRQSVMELARDMEKLNERIRLVEGAYRDYALTEKGMASGSIAALETLRYCGAMGSLTASTLCEVAHLDKIEGFSLQRANNVLREWGLDELE